MVPRRSASVLLIPFLLAPFCLADEAAKTTAAPVPQTVLQKIDEFFRPPGRPRTREEYTKMLAQYAKQMQDLLKTGEQAEGKYPKAANLHVLRVRMLEAAHFLAQYRKSDPARKNLLAVAGRLAASAAPPKSRVQADYFVTLDKIAPSGKPPAKDAGKQIRTYVKRYGKTPAEATALIRAVDLAKKTGQTTVEKELLDTLEKDHATDGAAHLLLRRAGRRPPFYAEVSLLNGKKLSLPDGAKGKVLVVDFWAMWCPPCLVALPHMKQLYAKYKPKGVEFLGISLDRANSRDKLAAFIKTNQIEWLHAYSGKYWDDPTARHYGIRGIPSVWVIGKDGRVVSDNARGNLEGVIQQALAAPAPASGSAAKK